MAASDRAETDQLLAETLPKIGLWLATTTSQAHDQLIDNSTTVKVSIPKTQGDARRH